MKKWVMVLLSLAMSFYLTPIWAHGYETAGYEKEASVVSGKDLDTQLGNMYIKGRLPYVSGMSAPGLEAQINKRVNEIYLSKSAKAHRDKAKSIVFSYDDMMSDGEVRSLLLYTAITNETVRKEVDTINFSAKTDLMVTVEDVLGPNGLAMANAHILDVITANPESYWKDFESIQDTQGFYVKNGKIFFVFNPFENGLARNDIIEISMDLEKIMNMRLTKDQYRVESDYNIKMIPLREVCQEFGYSVNWDEKNHSVRIEKGEFSTQITVDKNSYWVNEVERELEAAPEIYKNTMYAPISFFNTVLNIYYATDKNASITFSVYDV